MTKQPKYICRKCEKPLRSRSSAYSKCPKGETHDLVKIEDFTGEEVTENTEQTSIAEQEKEENLDTERELITDEEEKEIDELKKTEVTHEQIFIDGKNKKITKKNFIMIFERPWSFGNRKLSSWDEEGELKWLAEVWEFEREERIEFLGALYDILDEVVPDFLVWLNGQGYFKILGSVIALGSALLPRFWRSGKGFYTWRKLKTGKYILLDGKLAEIQETKTNANGEVSYVVKDKSNKVHTVQE